MVAEEAAPEEVREPDHEVKPNEPESRLNPLRGLSFSLGLKNLGKARGVVAREETSPLPLQSEVERTGITRSFTPFAEPVPVVVEIAEPVPVAAIPVETKAPIASQKEVREVTTLPEFLPPKEFIPIRDREEGRESGLTSRSDRRDAYDDVQILPSRRGQYKKRG
jgi:hypothetical protein